MDDERIISVKKKPFTTSNQVKNTLRDEGVSLLKSTIKRCLYEWKCRGFTTGCTWEQEAQITLCQGKNKRKNKKHLKESAQFGGGAKT